MAFEPGNWVRGILCVCHIICASLCGQVVLVGGSSRVPWVRQFIHGVTGIEPSVAVDPEECVAIGAAIYAGMLSGQVQGIELTDGAYAQQMHDRTSGFPLAHSGS